MSILIPDRGVMLNLKQTIKTGVSDVTGCCILSNGKMVFVSDSSIEVIIVHQDGSRDYTINIISGNPRDVTCIDSNTIAVSVADKDNEIRILDLSNRSITRRISTETTVCGITYNNGFLICCAKDKGLIRIDLRDDSITPVVRCSLSHWSYVTTNGNNMYYTNYDSSKVTCCDMNGRVQWEFCDDGILVLPSGIATDNNNNIYVVSEGINTLGVISPDGQSYKALLTECAGIRHPWMIHCDRASNQLFFTNRTDDTGLLFDISTTPT